MTLLVKNYNYNKQCFLFKSSYELSHHRKDKFWKDKCCNEFNSEKLYL